MCCSLPVAAVTLSFLVAFGLANDPGTQLIALLGAIVAQLLGIIGILVGVRINRDQSNR